MERLRLPAVIKWRRGKITDVIRSSSSRKSDLHFDYDAMGNRICKIVKPRNGSGVLNQAEWTYTYYTRDAQGNVIAVYERDYMYPGTNFFDELTLKENDLYGSSRVGLKNDTTTIASRKYTFVTFNSDSTFDLSSPGGIAAVAAAVNSFTHALGRKSYELVNHLGNVLVTVSDMRTANSNLGTVYSYNAVVMSATDYYAFGSPMEGRSYSSASYRYGFNGQEKQNELHGNSGDAYDFGDRVYDGGLGRWLSVDPFSNKSPYISPYAAMLNNPIKLIDLGGDTVAVFGPDGTFIQFKDDGKSEWSGMTYKSITPTYDENGTAHFTYNGVTTFKFGDPENDVKDIKSGVITHIVVVPANEVVKMIGNAGAFEPANRDNNWNYIQEQGKGGGKFDFSYNGIPQEFPGASHDPLVSPSSMLFIPEGTSMAFNHMNFGNFLFGAAGYTLGFNSTVLLGGAHYNSVTNSKSNGYKPQLDSFDDQLAIALGAEYAKILQLDQRTWNAKSGLSKPTNTR